MPVALLRNQKAYLGGKWSVARSGHAGQEERLGSKGMAIATVNPATEEVLHTFRELNLQEIEEKLTISKSAFRSHSKTSFEDRARKMQRAAEILDSEKELLGRLMTIEMGKPIKGALQEAEKCAWVCRYYAENAARMLADEDVESNATRSFVKYQPLGPILAVMPWNFPFWQVFRFAAPALMAGNVGLLKHSSNVPQCALAIEDIFVRAGFTKGVFQTLLIGSDKVPRVIEDDRVVAATLTGSEPAGSSVASLCGKKIKKTVLELGGSDPFIIMPSANLDVAVQTGVKARTINNGQSCIAAKRFIVHHEIYDEFTRQFVEQLRNLKIGDPLDPSTEIGPLATADVLRSLEEQVQKSVEAGAKVLTGGKRLEGKGYYYSPTVLVDIPESSPAHREELFGPVALFFRARDIDEAIEIANDSPFGLGSSAWTNDRTEIERFSTELQAGSVFINGMVASDPRLPFGGIKHSGYGRELGTFGIREFVNIKTVWIREDAGVSLSETE
jgi:succinate-semialdehyde dehydrogenase/glutarate-semialdehyde dehydrogenase